MGVNTKPAEKAAEVKITDKLALKAADAPVTPELVALVLAAYERYVFRNTVFEKGAPFAVSEGYAADLLRHKTDSDAPVFTRYNGDVKPVEVAPPPIRVVAEPADQPASNAPVELATDEELAELGLKSDPQGTVNGEAEKTETPAAGEVTV